MLDIVCNVAEEKSTRPRTIPIWDDKYAWWTEAVERELAARKWNRAELARRLDVGAWDITRSVNRGGATVELVTRIADLLGLPYPLFLPESEPEAREIMDRRQLAKHAARLEQEKQDLEQKLAAAMAAIPKPPRARRRRQG